MKIAIASNIDLPEGIVPDFFAGSPYLLIIETRFNKILANIKNEGDDAELASKLVPHNCECVLCGPIEEAPFCILANAGITRYNAAGLSIEYALDDFEQNALELIRDHIGGIGCRGDHKHL